MYVARFSYDLLPSNRQQGIDFVRKEVETAFSNGLNARLLVPLTRGQSGGPAFAIRGRVDKPRSARPVPQPGSWLG
jgi:hypothetical protein